MQINSIPEEKGADGGEINNQSIKLAPWFEERSKGLTKCLAEVTEMTHLDICLWNFWSLWKRKKNYVKMKKFTYNEKEMLDFDFLCVTLEAHWKMFSLRQKALLYKNPTPWKVIHRMTKEDNFFFGYVELKVFY